jgi:hypothetical protein
VSGKRENIPFVLQLADLDVGQELTFEPIHQVLFAFYRVLVLA